MRFKRLYQSIDALPQSTLNRLLNRTFENRDTTVDTITTNPYVRVFGLCVFVCEDSNSVYGADDKQDRDLENYEELKEK